MYIEYLTTASIIHNDVYRAFTFSIRSEKDSPSGKKTFVYPNNKLTYILLKSRNDSEFRLYFRFVKCKHHVDNV